MFDSHLVRSWPDDSDGEGGRQVQIPSAEVRPVSHANAVSRHEERMQTNAVTDSEDEEPEAERGGSQCTVYESDDDDDGDDAAEASLREAVLPAAVLPAAAASYVLTAEAACATVAASTEASLLSEGLPAAEAPVPAARAAPSASQLTLRQAVATVNDRLHNKSDLNLISAQQVNDLGASLSGLSDLLSLEKGDIKDVLMDKSFGGVLTLKQALFMQAYILELKRL